MQVLINVFRTLTQSAIQALVWALALLVLPSLSQAASTELLKYKYYDVTSVPNQKLGMLINFASPVREGSQVFHGSTTWSVSWSVAMQTLTNGTCKIKSVETLLDATILLPKLIDGTESQGMEFIRYIGALKEHELGHYKYGQQAVRAVDKAILAMPAMKDCKTLENEVAKRANAISDEYTLRSRQYDVNTEHGRTQGAWLTL